MTKRMTIMLIITGLILGGIFGFQAFKGYMIKKYLSGNIGQTVTVSTMIAKPEEWQPTLRATGSLRAVQGVDVTTELAGLVRSIEFTSGTEVKAGDVLVNLNVDTDLAQLHALEATLELARVTYERTKAQYSVKTVSKSALDADTANLKNQEALVAQQRAVVAKKIIRAPFSGHIGILAINVGQYINPGDKIATLQSLDPIYVDFTVPQEAVVRLKKGQVVNLTLEAYPDGIFTGKISALDPKADPSTRNIQIEAIVDNPEHKLLPGMYASVAVETDAPEQLITLPQTAISYNPYGELIFVVIKGEPDKDSKPRHTVTQRFIKVGQTRGDQVAILAGVQEGDEVVTSGQMKLKKGSFVMVNNDVQPNNNPAPTPVDQ